MRTIAAVVIAFVTGTAPCAAADVLDAFPPAEQGMVRHVIQLPERGDEADLKVELIVGKTIRTDTINKHFFAGALVAETIPGWGYERYILRDLGPLAATLMAVPPDAPLVDSFVTTGGDRQILRYNSRVPLVVYVPAGVEVRHRLWHADPPNPRARKVTLPDGATAVVAEGEFEARSIGSYTVRIYAAGAGTPGDDTTFFKSGLIRPRKGSVEQVQIARLGPGREPYVVVTVRSAGSGSYLSADAFSFAKGKLRLVASVGDLPRDADPVAALKSH
jgi:ecotin